MGCDICQLSRSYFFTGCHLSFKVGGLSDVMYLDLEPKRDLFAVWMFLLIT